MSSSDQRQLTPTVHNLINNSPLRPYLDVPSVRVDYERNTVSSLSNYNDESVISLPNWFIKVSLILASLMAFTVNLFGHGPLFRLTQCLGFILVLVFSFLVLFTAFLWWASFVEHQLNFDTVRIIKLYCVCCLSELIAALSNYVVDLGMLEHFPIDIAFYSVFALSVFSLFSGIVHSRGIAAMFSHETTTFVLLLLLLHYCTSCLFDNIIPTLLYTQLLYCSCLFALSCSLYMTKNHLNLTLSSLKHFIRTSITAPGRTIQSSRKLSVASVNSTLSSIQPRNSVTSQSSYGTSIGNNLDIDTLNEAHGILGDILFQESHLTKKGKESLKHIQDLLAPRVTRTANVNPVRSRINSGVSDDESDTGSSIGVNPHMYGYKSTKTHRKSVRNTSSQFTTTTTATGLPNVVDNPSERKRSVAPRDIKARISVVEGAPSVHSRYSRGRIGSFTSPLSMRYRNSSSAASSPLFSNQISDASDIESTSFNFNDDRQPVATDTAQLNSINEFVESNGTTNKSTRRRVGVSTESKPIFTIPVDSVNGDTTSNNNEEATDGIETETEASTPRITNHQVPSLLNSRVSLFNPLIIPSTDYSLDEYQQGNIELLERVMDWDFPIFELEKVAGDHILSQMAYCLFLEAGLIETFEIPRKQFLNYFRILEANYGSNSYHNKTHAADVLHATSYLLFEQIPDFSFEISRSSERAWIGSQRKPTGGNIASAMSILEVFTCYMAAAMHDFDHPGRTNAFLVATKSPLAVLYNDKSVLENHHAAASWDLLTSIPDNNFLLKLDETELKRFRFLLIECILATDLKLHFDIVRDFKDKTQDNTGIDWEDDIERLQVMKMVIKMADINTATKSYDLHRAWTVRITEEFYQQNDEEVKLALPSTIFMNRNEKHKLPAVQVSFIQNLVSPLFQASAKGGVIPGIIEHDNNEQQQQKDPFEDLSDVDDHVLEENMDEAVSELPTHKFVSIILTNLEMNFEAWKSELPQPEETPSVDDTHNDSLTDDSDTDN